jgi:hypothetical protein
MMISWPTSPTWVESRNGVEPAGLREQQRRAVRCALRVGPAHTAESGMRWARFSVWTSG